MAGVALGYSFPLLFTTLFAIANLFNVGFGEDDKISCLLKQRPSCQPCHALGKPNCFATLHDVGFGIKELCLPSESLSYGQKLKQLASSDTGRFSNIGYTIPDFVAEACTCDSEKNKVVHKACTCDSEKSKVVQEIVEVVHRIQREKGEKRFTFLNVGSPQRLNLDEDRFGYLDRLIEKYNEQLEKKFKGLDDATISILNYYGIIKNIMDHPDLYGLDRQTIKTACCGWGPYKGESCGSLDSLRCEEHINHLLAGILWKGNKFASQRNTKSIGGLEKTAFDFLEN